MQEISFLLKRYENLGLKELKTREIILKVLKNNINSEIKKDDFIIRGNEIKIKTNNFLKSELLILKNKIEKEINSKLEEEGFTQKKISNY